LGREDPSTEDKRASQEEWKKKVGGDERKKKSDVRAARSYKELGAGKGQEQREQVIFSREKIHQLSNDLTDRKLRGK